MCEAGDDGYGLQPQLILMRPGIVFVKIDSISIDFSASSLPAGFERRLKVPDKGSSYAIVDDKLFNQRMADDLIFELLEGCNLLLDRCRVLDFGE